MVRQGLVYGITGATVIAALGSSMPADALLPPPPPPPSYSPAQIADMKTHALAGEADVQMNLGRVYQEGLGVPKDYSAAQTWYKMAAGNGVQNGQASYDQITFFITAHAARYKAAMTGDSRAEYLFAVHEPHGATGIENDYPETHWMKLSATQGYREAESSLGDLYFRAYVDREWNPQADAGLDSPSATADLAGAILWLEKAAVQGDTVAQAVLADIYAIDGPTQDAAKTQYWLEQVAASEITYFTLSAVEKLCSLEFTGGLHGHAANEFAQSTRMDITLPPDYAKAFACYTRINTTFGVNSADYQLGYMYRHGLGTAPDDTKALALLTNASQGRYDVIPAQYELAMIYAEGRIVPRDLVKADILLTQAIKAWAPEALPNRAPFEPVPPPWPSDPETQYYERQADDAHRQTAEGWLTDLHQVEQDMTANEKAKAKAILAE